MNMIEAETGKQPDTPPPAPEKKTEAKPRRKTFIRRRDVLILVTVWLVGCGLVGALVIAFYLIDSTPPEAAPMISASNTRFNFSGQTAKDAYLAALPEAREWADDVQLVSVSAHWADVTPETVDQVDIWDFSFFSAGHNRIFFTLVLTDQQAIGRAHPYRLKKPPHLVDPTRWTIDSDEAISIWLNNGGSVFLTTFPDNEVEALLRQSESIENPRPVWNIIGTSADQSQIFYLIIDASTGTVLN